MKAAFFNLHEGDVNDGEFQDLEEKLKEKGIPFDRQTGMEWSISPCTRIYRPGPPEFDHYYPQDDDGNVVVSVETIQEIVYAYAEEECRSQLYGALTYYLHEHFPPYPPLADYVKEAQNARTHQ